MFDLYMLGTDEKVLVNVGSVGQPRDGDPRACFITFDGDTVVWRRVAYNVESTVNALSFLAVLSVLLLMRTADLFALDRGGPRPKGLDGIREGLTYVLHEPRLRMLIALAAVIGVSGFNFRAALQSRSASPSWPTIVRARQRLL